LKDDNFRGCFQAITYIIFTKEEAKDNRIFTLPLSLHVKLKNNTIDIQYKGLIVGKKIVLTGATNGLGRLAAITFAKRGMELILIVRSQLKASELEAEIHSVAPHATMHFYIGDLSLLHDIVRLGTEISQDFPEIDALVNNAGVHTFSQKITPDGFSEMTTVNYFAPWILTQVLQKNLERSKQGRVVNVASEASRNDGVLTLPDELRCTKPYRTRESSVRYGRSKLLILMFSLTLTTRLKNQNMAVVALCPGFNVTGLGRDLSFSKLLAKILNFFNIGNPQKGADLIVHLTLDEPWSALNGAYYSVKAKQPIAPITIATNPEIQQLLWYETEKLLAEKDILV